MRWPSWLSASSKEQDEKSQSVSWKNSLSVTNWTHYTNPQTLLPTVLLTGSVLLLTRFYRSYLRRIPQATYIKPAFWRRRSLLGRVTSVGDGDNFRLFHTPGGRLTGWGWMPGRKVPKTVKELKDKTIHIRLAGVDAPEQSHFGRPSQPFSQDALDWLTSYVLHRRVRAYIYKRDQYERAVATVYIWKWLWRRDVGLQMIRAGLATVYEAKSGAEFGKVEAKYREAEKWAKMKKKGMWGGNPIDYESPRDYKARGTQIKL